MKHIVCFHLLNDYSGSPKVLKMILQGILDKGGAVDLVTSNGGTLDELADYKNLKRISYRYRFSANPALTMLRYFTIQIYTFLLAFRYIFNKDTVFYINTLLPVGAALAGRLMGKRIVYHYHENAFAKGMFYKILCRMMQLLANEIICVSDYQSSFLSRKNDISVIPNALPKLFCNAFQNKNIRKGDRKVVLMLSSLKLYKGTLEFIDLSRRLKQYDFHLVINDTKENIRLFAEEYGVQLSENLQIFDRQDNVIPFYENASLVLNLSNKKMVVETFGLTVLEAMTAGLPVIVPTVGGIAEMVEDGINGYKIDVQDLDKIEACISKIFSDTELYRELSVNAKRISEKYDNKWMIDKISLILDK